MGDYRAAIIGCGGRGHMHASAYNRIANGTLVACCDIEAAKADQLGAAFGVKAYTNAAEMISAANPDIVHITTPPTARHSVLSVVSDAGVPGCTVEKPLAVGVPDWHDLSDLASTTSTKIAVCHQFRWHENFTKCREALSSGSLGNLLFLDISSGMNISGQGTHLLNYGFALNGDSPAVRIFGAASGSEGMNDFHPGPDTTAGYMTFQNGVRALWNNGPTAPVVGDPETDWQHVRLAGYAEKGRVLWEEFGTWEIISGSSSESGTFGSREIWHEQNLDAQAAFHQAMFSWIEDDAKPVGTNFIQSLHEWKTVLALYYSSLIREPVDVLEFDPSADLFDRLRDALDGTLP